MRINSRWRIAAVAIVGLGAAPAFAGFVDPPEKPPRERAFEILRRLHRYPSFDRLTQTEQLDVYFTASTAIGYKFCLKPDAQGKTAALPAWLTPDTVGVVDSLYDPITPDHVMDERRTLTWALIGMLTLDAAPCDLAKEITEGLGKP